MMIKNALARLYALLHRRDRIICPSADEIDKAKKIMTKLTQSKDVDIIDRAAKLKSLIEGCIDGENDG